MAHDAFLRAILDAPDDDAPRLIYADWLDEHDDPARAEFIRVQCARFAFEVRDEPMSVAHRRMLDMREMELAARYQAEWAAGLEGLADQVYFERGFVAGIRIAGERLTEEPESILRRAPIQRLTVFWGITPPATRGQLLHRLCTCPDLGRLRTLDLAGGYIGSTGLSALAACEYLTGVRYLDLTGNHVGDAGLRALATSPMLTSLEMLHLRDNDIGPSGIRCLIAELRALEVAGQPTALRVVDLRGNRLGAAGRQEIHDYPLLRRLVRL